jgi:ribonuclease-3
MSETLAEHEFILAADDDLQDLPVVPPEPESLPPDPASELEAPPPEPEDVQFTRMERCERRIGYVFQDKELLREALTHASSAEHRLASNERLEFLGDAILGAIVCELLFQRYPEYQEGDLTKIKSVVVSRQSCAKISEALGLQEFLIVGKGVSASPSIPLSLLADVLESLIGAIHLDGGSEAAKRFIEGMMGPEIELAAIGELGGNFKSLLQQLAQREFASTPAYELLDEKGPDHRKCFKVAAQVGGTRYQAAWGRNKKEAEQRAACNALAEIKGEPAIFPSD